MENPFLTPDISLKTIEINNEENKYICRIELIEELIQANLIHIQRIN